MEKANDISYNTPMELLLDNFFTLSLVVGLLIFTVSSKSFDKKTTFFFITSILIILFLDIADMIDFYLQGFSVVNNFRYVSSSLGYILRPSLLAVIISILLRYKRSYYTLWIPLVLFSIIVFTNPLTHLMFWFDEQNNFKRGYLGYLPHIISGLYMIIMVVLTIKMHTSIGMGEVFVIIYIMVLCAVATAIESAAGKKFLLPGAMIVSCSIYYIYLYTQVYKKDVLTGLLNRRSFYLDAQKLAACSIAVVSIDLNGLKTINDTKGHSEGDKALVAFANIAFLAGKKQFTLYRVGGDEFMALGKSKTADDAFDFIQLVKDGLSKTPYMASFGMALYDGSKNFDEVCNIADMQMYQDKSHYAHRQTARTSAENL